MKRTILLALLFTSFAVSAQAGVSTVSGGMGSVDPPAVTVAPSESPRAQFAELERLLSERQRTMARQAARLDSRIATLRAQLAPVQRAVRAASADNAAFKQKVDDATSNGIYMTPNGQAPTAAQNNTLANRGYADGVSYVAYSKAHGEISQEIKDRQAADATVQTSLTSLGNDVTGLKRDWKGLKRNGLIAIIAVVVVTALLGVGSFSRSRRARRPPP